MKKITGGELIARMLKAEGVDVAFGIVDGSYLALCAGMRKQGIELVTPRHESIGAHMAGAYSRLTGRLGVFMASNGPGVANVLSGAAVEAAEGHRVLLLTSCRRTGIHYPNRGGTYQAFDQVGVIGAMAKWSEAVHSADRIAELMRQALRACFSGRPGLVHLDVPENLINGELEPPPVLEPRQYRRVEPVVPSEGAVQEAARLLTAAKLPLIHAGGGVIHAAAFEELQAVAEALHAPVTTSWSARGVLDEDHPLAWAMVHVKSNNEVRNAADAVLCLGSRLGETDWWGKAPYWATPERQALIQVDLDEETLGRTRAVDLAVQADVKVFLRLLLAALKQQPLAERRKAVDKLAASQARERAKLDSKLDDREAPLLTAHLSDICDKLFEPDSVFVFDGGNTTVWGQFFHKVRVPNTVLTTYHMGHLGAGIGQALGAAIARPDRPVCCIIGDGAFGMHPQEVETAVRNELPVIFLVACDRQWGMVKMTQSMAFKPLKMMLKKQLDPDETINGDLGEIAYDELARSMGAHGERVSSTDELVSAVKRSLDLGGPAVIHVDVDPAKHLWAPALMHFKAMHQEPKGK
jgi:acetolactate synthase I/II/III large subunit